MFFSDISHYMNRLGLKYRNAFYSVKCRYSNVFFLFIFIHYVYLHSWCVSVLSGDLAELKFISDL